jgi:hypothetical protein
MLDKARAARIAIVGIAKAEPNGGE